MRNFSIDIIWAKIQVTITALGGWLGYFLGGIDGLLYALVVFVVLDYLTGIIRAIAEHELSSTVGFKGIAKKTILFALVGVAHTLDKHVVGGGAALRTATIFYELSNEGLSILENASCLGLPVPEKLKEALAQLHNRVTKDGEEEKKDGDEENQRS